MDKNFKSARKWLTDHEEKEERATSSGEYEMQNIERENEEHLVSNPEHSEITGTQNEEAMIGSTDENLSIESLSNMAQGDSNRAVVALDTDRLVEPSERVTGNGELLDTLPFSRVNRLEKPLYSSVSERIRSQKNKYLKSMVSDDEDIAAEILSPSPEAVNHDHELESSANIKEIGPVDEKAPLPDEEKAHLPDENAAVLAGGMEDFPIRPVVPHRSPPVGGLANRVRNGRMHMVPNGHALDYVPYEPRTPARSYKIGRNAYMWTICILLMIFFAKFFYMWVICQEKKSNCIQLAVSASALFLAISGFLYFLVQTIFRARCFRR